VSKPAAETPAYSESSPAWKKTLYSVWASQILAMMGFAFVIPFVPFYIRDLGVTKPEDVALWSGLCSSAPGIAMAIMAPIWGVLADRYGRKLMLSRALLGAAVLLFLMGRVSTVEQLFLLRLLQGGVTGTVAASIALVASVTPRPRLGFSLGLMQMAVYVGSCLGPLVGGVVASRYGYRIPFFITSGMMVVAGVLVLWGAREHFQRAPAPAKGGIPGGLRRVLAAPGFTTMLAVLFAINLASLIVGPIFPLFVERMARGSTASPAAVVGQILAATGVAAAVGASIVGKWGDRFGNKRVLIYCTALSGLFCLPQAFAHSVHQLFGWRILLGLASGGTIPTVNAIIGRLVPRDSYGRTFGITASATSVGMAVGPALGGVLGSQFGLQLPFLLMGAMLVAISVAVSAAVPPAGEAGEERPSEATVADAPD
jgi:DHA1 family multidrug resistance protein-like MFS transporter